MSPSENKKTFSSLMLEGINITRKAQEGDAIYGKENQLQEVFDDYHIWKSRIKDFLTNTNSNSLEWYQFYQADSVPSLKGGLEYGDITSEVSQSLLKKIRLETTGKLQLLKLLGDSLFPENLPKVQLPNTDTIKLGKENSFSFNVVTGDSVLNGTKTNFKVGQQKFKIINTILSSKEHQADYESMSKILGFENNKTKHADIQQIIKTIKEDLKILPRKKSSNPDILFNIEKYGFRIVVE